MNSPKHGFDKPESSTDFTPSTERKTISVQYCDPEPLDVERGVVVRGQVCRILCDRCVALASTVRWPVLILDPAIGTPRALYLCWEHEKAFQADGAVPAGRAETGRSTKEPRT